MDEIASKALKSVGISAAIITGISIVAVAFFAYKNYQESVYMKYQIMQIKRDLGIKAKA